MTGTGGKSRKKGLEKYAKKEQLILDVALKLFFTYGLKKTTVDDIAKKAGVAKGSLYNYFDSKEEMLKRFMDKGNKLAIDVIKDAISKQKTSRGKLKALAMEKVKFFKRSAELFGLKQFINEDFLSTVQKLRKDYFEQEKEIRRDIFLYGMKRKEIRNLGENEMDILNKVFGLVTKGMEGPWVLDKDIREIEKHLDFMLCVAFDGIKAQ